MRTLGKTGIKVLEIGCGGIPVQRVNLEIISQMIDKMIELGVNFIDTARGYTISEELFGKALLGKRDKFIIATKSMSRDYESMKRDIDISLKKINTDYIDIYQLHNVSLGEDYFGALKALYEAKKENKIGHIGLTTHSLDVFKEAINNGQFETIQFPYNIVETQAEELFKEAYEKNIGIIVMKPLAGGAIMDYEVALKFILENKYVSVVIPGMESVLQVTQNVNVIKQKIADEDKIKINQIKNFLSSDFCRRCGYCMPCAVGINIPFSFLCEGYYSRYNLKEWAISRYETMKIKPSSCIGCGMCEKKCPYNLKIIDKLKNVVKIMEGQKDEK